MSSTTAEAEQDFSWERIIAHEIAHQWWGDLITLREWSHTWLNESFGTYSDYLWTRAEKGEDEGAWDLLGKKNQYLREAQDRYIRPIVFDRYDLPGDNFDSHTYPKGACILHQLRYLLGDEPFFRTLSAFLHEYAFQPVDTHDFMKTVKEVTGRNMDWFFDQFIFLPGHPVFEVTSDWDAEAGEIRLHVTQVQSRDHGVPIYRDAGADRDRHPVRERGWRRSGSTRSTTAFVFPSSGRAPSGSLRRGKLASEGVELREERGRAPLPGQKRRRRSGGSGRSGSWPTCQICEIPSVAEVLMNLAREDPFWAVRVAALEALGT